MIIKIEENDGSISKHLIGKFSCHGVIRYNLFNLKNGNRWDDINFMSHSDIINTLNKAVEEELIKGYTLEDYE